MLQGAGTVSCSLNGVNCSGITVNVTAATLLRRLSPPPTTATANDRHLRHPTDPPTTTPPLRCGDFRCEAAIRVQPHSERNTKNLRHSDQWQHEPSEVDSEVRFREDLLQHSGHGLMSRRLPTGSTCSYTGPANGNYSVKSSTTFVIEATSADDTSKVSDVTFNVCNPTVQVSTVPAYRTLYANQAADIQSLVVGAVDQTVHWAITQKPADGDGQLADTTARDTVFTASVPGRYTLTATSNADSRKTATATIYVTGHKMPYRVTPNQTEPVDCSVDPRLLGRVYEVGPSQTYKTLASVPFPTMTAGSTVRVAQRRHHRSASDRVPRVRSDLAAGHGRPAVPYVRCAGLCRQSAGH